MTFNVFQYDESRIKVDETKAEGLREAVAEFVCQCLRLGEPVSREEFLRKIPKLPFGSYSPRKSRKDELKGCLDDLIWKYTELAGKYCGCQYWSVRAKALFDHELQRTCGDSALIGDACKLARRFCRKELPELKRFEHEHVYPKKDLIKHLRQLAGDVSQSLCQSEMRTLLDRLAVSCVVLKEEHRQVHPIPGVFGNPWLRYQGTIRLADNLSWRPWQRDLIQEAGLL